MSLEASLTHRCCPACGNRVGGATITKLSLRTPDGHPLQGGYTIVSCSVCGCGFADVAVPTSYYDHYYSGLAKYAGEITVYATRRGYKAGFPAPLTESAWLLAKADDSAQRIDTLLTSRTARVLDVGCATGSLLAALGRIGYTDLHGVDPSADSIRIANSRPGIHAEVGLFSSLPAGLGTFDLICVTGVFEHLWDVDLVVDSLRPLLRPSGVLYVEVPDASRYLDPYVSPYEDFSTEHVNHFSFSCLRRLAARLGMETISEISYESPLTPLVVTSFIAVAWTKGMLSNSEETRDTGLEAKLIAFAERSERDLGQIAETLERGLGSSSAYIIWGIGETAFKLLPLPSLASRNAEAFVDSNPSRWGFRFGGVPVIAPTEITSSTLPIVVSSLIRADSIVAAASQLGLSNPMVSLDRWQKSARSLQ